VLQYVLQQDLTASFEAERVDHCIVCCSLCCGVYCSCVAECVAVCVAACVALWMHCVV